MPTGPKMCSAIVLHWDRDICKMPDRLSGSTYSKRHHQVDHALLVVTLPATEAEPLIHHTALPQAFRDGDMGPCYPVVHRERSLDGKKYMKTNNMLTSVIYMQKAEVCCLHRNMTLKPECHVVRKCG